MGVITDPGKRKDNMHDIELVSIDRVSEHAYQFTARLIPEASAGPLTWRPGQWAYLIDSQGFRADQRAFSFASAPSDEEIAFGIEVVPGGLFTPRIVKWAVGDRFTIRGPYGTFQLQEPQERDLVLIGFNAGIVPFRSFLRHLTRPGAIFARSVALLSLATSPEFTFYDAEFRDLASAHANIRYEWLETGSPDPTILPLDALAPLLADPALAAAQIYIAGLGKFIEGIAGLLEAEGVPKGQIAAERYD